jgi:hypothetical protein
MNPIAFLAFPGDLVAVQAFLTNKQGMWRWLDPPQEQAYVKIVLFETRYRRQNTSMLRTYLNSPYTPKRAYNGALNLLEPA